jgi:uroporphyrinogen-III synthase
MRVVLTRPRQESDRWAKVLGAHGHEVLPLPLIAIGPAPDDEAVRQAWQNLPRCQAAMFVSGSAVRGFRAACPQQAWPAATRAWCTGPGTAQALIDAGVPGSRIDAPDPEGDRFDSEALWADVAVQVKAGSRVLIVRGAGPDGRPAGRDWLAARLEEAGAQTGTVASYTRRLPGWGAGEKALAASADDATVWLFSSSEALANLGALLPGRSWSRARAIATHERIAQAAREAGFGVVCLSRPVESAVIATLESFG